MPFIPIQLLTGFLGRGKTTLLNHLLKQSEMSSTLVIINEFGDIGLDHLLVTFSSENQEVIEVSGGCIFCNLRSDLKKTLKDIAWRFSRDGKKRFDRVLIETTGLADPAPLLHTISGIYNWRFLVVGEALNFEARFDYLIDLKKTSPILHHHSSQIPRAL